MIGCRSDDRTGIHPVRTVIACHHDRVDGIDIKVEDKIEQPAVHPHHVRRRQESDVVLRRSQSAGKEQDQDRKYEGQQSKAHYFSSRQESTRVLSVRSDSHVNVPYSIPDTRPL